MRWLIFEDALKDKRGHYFEYLSTFKRGLEACGDEVTIFTDRTAEPWIAESLDSLPCLPRCIWRRASDGSPRWKKLLRYPVHGWQTFRSVGRALRRNRNADVAFFPSVSTHHLLGLVPLFFIRRRILPKKVILFFQCTPILPDASALGGAKLNPEATARLLPLLLRLLGPLVRSGRVVLGVETEAMRAALTSLCGLPFVYFPHPVSLPAEIKSALTGEEATSEIVFGLYGTTRYEKGNDLLQTAVRKYLAGTHDARARFVMQWTEDFHDDRGALIQKDPVLQSHSRVTYLTDYFAPDGGYLRQVAKTGIMVLPYRDSYAFRLSRVVIEAILAGVPVIVQENTTLAEQASEHGSAVTFRHEDPNGLLGAMRRAVSEYDILREKAARCAETAAQHFSVKEFRATLLREMSRAASQNAFAQN